MRKLFLFVLLIPVVGICQTANVINSFRILPKAGKAVELEKAIVAHEAKYHKGDWKWRTYDIQSGPDAGGYMIIEGPLTWEQFDTRGNLGAEHTADWEKTVAPLTEKMSSQGFSTFNAELSNVNLSEYTEKIIISHVYPLPGMVNGVTDLIKKLKKAWVAGNESIAVYAGVASGPPEFVMVSRLKNGLKELDSAYRKPLPQRFNDVYGEGAWNYYLADYAKFVERRWSELLFFRADLSSK